MTREEEIKKQAEKKAHEPSRLIHPYAKQYKVMSAYEIGFIEGAVWADAHPHWISVEDELPKDYEPVLAAFANHFARVCFHCGKTWYLSKPLAAEEMEGITHWMPLPQPPKEGGEE